MSCSGWCYYGISARVEGQKDVKPTAKALRKSPRNSSLSLRRALRDDQDQTLLSRSFREQCVRFECVVRLWDGDWSMSSDGACLILWIVAMLQKRCMIVYSAHDGVVVVAIVVHVIVRMVVQQGSGAAVLDRRNELTPYEVRNRPVLMPLFTPIPLLPLSTA